MSVNRNSDLNTSLSRTEGVRTTYLNLSSADRDKSIDLDSADAELSFDPQSNVIGMSIVNFEIPHTRYAINKTNNNFYISEKWGEDEYYFYSLRASTGGYTIQDLAVSLELSTRCPVLFNGDNTMGNNYFFVTAGVFGKVAVISSGDKEYSIHNANETVTLTSITKKSDTEAIVTYLSSQEYIFQAGALLLLKPYDYYDREVQIVEMVGGRTARVIGDFSDIDESTIQVSSSTMVPYSAKNSVSRIMGMGDMDLTGNTSLELLSMASPFDVETQGDFSSVMCVVNFPIFVSPGDFVMLEGSDSFMNNTVFEVGEVHDDTHIEILVDKSTLWGNTSGSVISVVPNDPSASPISISSISFSSSANNIVDIVVTPSSASSLSVGDSVSLSGVTSPEMIDMVLEVKSVSSSSTDFVLSFTYPSVSLSVESGETTLTPVNNTTGLRTTYLTPYRFDLSRGRRMVLCRAIIDNQDVGSIHIPSLSTRNFFGRIQLFSGADLVNFLNDSNAVGKHEFNSVLKRLNRIRFQFFNEDGSGYDFIGVDYTIFLKITSLDSNNGI